MAERDVSLDHDGANHKVFKWLGLLNGDVGRECDIAEYADLTVTFNITPGGSFGLGGTIVLEGSNDLVNWFTLTDAQGNAISKTAAAIEVVEEAPRYIRPNVTAGDGTTNLECWVTARRGSR